MEFENVTAGTDFENSVQKLHGFRMVIMEMTLAFLGVVFNLMVLISIREKESLLESTVNVVLANLCFANLISAVFVKSIAVIYNGYAVAASLWEVELAFCAIHTVTFRATWVVFPYSIVVICWNGLADRVQMIFRAKAANVSKLKSTKTIAHHSFRTAAALDHSHSASTSQALEEDCGEDITSAAEDVEWNWKDDDNETEEDTSEGGLDARNKAALGFIWLVAAAYAIMSKEIMSKERFVPCSVRQELTDRINMLSIVLAIGVPVLLGPILCPIVHVVLTVCNLCCHACVYATKEDGEEKKNGCSCLLDFGLVFFFSVVLLVVYPTHMYVTEIYLATAETHFAFMAFKYCFGCMHLVILPIIILIIKRDIRNALIDVCLKRTSLSPNIDNSKGEVEH